MSPDHEHTYRPFAFAPDGYRPLEGTLACLSGAELSAEHERLLGGIAALLPPDGGLALDDLDQIMFEISQRQIIAVMEQSCLSTPRLTDIVAGQSAEVRMREGTNGRCLETSDRSLVSISGQD